MGNTRLSKHAQKRSQQRSIPREVIELILRYGKRRYHRGANIHLMDKKTLHWARTHMGTSYKRLEEKLRKCYLVVIDGEVITIAHRTGRLKF